MEGEDICGHVRKVGPISRLTKLNELRDLPIVGDVRGHRFMMCVENVADQTTGELFSEEVDIGRRISRHCEGLGLIVRPIGPLNVISPPLILTKAQVDELAGLLRQGIEATMVDLRKEGLLRA
jgi:adenosylmethionine-8-amino-7-oxononanoate aminotransferase